MSIKVTKGNIIVEVSTGDELRMVLNALGDTERRSVSIHPKSFVTDIDTLVSVFERIPSYSKSCEALHLLAKYTTGMTTQELVKELGLSSEQALGGVFGNIGRYAKELGVDTSDIYKWTIVENRGVYKLTKEMTEAIHHLSEDKQEGE